MEKYTLADIKIQQLQIFIIFLHIHVDVVNFWKLLHIREQFFYFFFTLPSAENKRWVNAESIPATILNHIPLP